MTDHLQPVAEPVRRPRRFRALPAAPAERRGLRLAASGLAVLLALAGIAVFSYSPGTDTYQGHLQARLAGQLTAPETRQAYVRHTIAEGDSLTRLRIPTIGVDVVVVEGTSASALRAGAGHYPGTPLPGEGGNVAIAGHRTTYGHPFADLDRVAPGDEVLLDTPVGPYRYRVTRPPFVVDKADWSPIAATAGKTLTLSTCHPKRSDRQRLIVQAELVPGESR
jgi:sortase A